MLLTFLQSKTAMRKSTCYTKTGPLERPAELIGVQKMIAEQESRRNSGLECFPNDVMDLLLSHVEQALLRCCKLCV